ncbi:hypothetical protein GQ44DRAFT_768567 [Phaeosphaeriaceae sp. PMI808]|nr:hypothetical protein GQ44DRAFT_768567 [Phaeosphaeriaceae sp. PMI808]
MRFSIAIPLAFAVGALAAPVDDCSSLKSLSKLNGAQIFCSQSHPAAPGTPAAVEVPKSNAKRFKEDDERVVRLLNRLPESRQKAFCSCFPAAASGTVSVSASVSATPSASATAAP